jgi:MerR family transcriptional regulator, mercuric resistance operon regulatory protein
MTRPGTSQGYRIGHVGRLTGLTVDALRYYERLGLLPKAPRTSGGLRAYDEAAVRRVRFIRQAQRLGLSLRDIRELVGSAGQQGRAACGHIRDVLTARLADLDAQLAELRAFRRTLARYRTACERALEQPGDPPCPTLDSLDRRSR